MTLPRVLWRIEWLEGFGWPECERREKTSRTYASAQGAREMLETIRKLPSHHTLLGIWQTKTDWLEVPVELIGEEEDR